jgi:ribosomal protein L11 methyltransferase
MKWYEITVNTTSEGTDLIADAFFSVGCLGGVKIIDKKDILDILDNKLMWDYVDEDLFRQSETAKVSAFVGKDELETKLDEFKKFTTERNYPVGEITVNEVDDSVWYENWKKYYAPIEIGKFSIVPKWIKYDKKGFTKILIDPGMAFGTGEHESTKMCLSMMSETDFHGKDVIDVGCGSGILGIGATLSGAKSCYMCDIDSVAVTAARENAKTNGLDGAVTVETADLLQKKEKKADVVLANLTADILIRLSKELPKHINKGGSLICSGIIHSRKREVIDAFSSAGFALCKQLVMGDWDGLSFVY